MATTQQVAPATSPPAQAPPSGTRRNVSAAEWAAAALKISQARAQSRERLKEAAATSASAFDKLYALRKSGGSPEQLAAANAEYLRASAAVAKENKTMTRLTSRQMTAEYRARAAAGEQAPAIRGSVTPSAGDDPQTIQSLNMTDVLAPWRKEGEGAGGWADSSARQTPSTPENAPTRTAPQTAASERMPTLPGERPSDAATQSQSPKQQKPDQKQELEEAIWKRGGTVAGKLGNTPLSRVRTIGTMTPDRQRRYLPSMITWLTRQIPSKQARRGQDAVKRKKELGSLASVARPTLVIFVIFAVIGAGVFDLFDLIKQPIANIPFLGWGLNLLIGTLKAVTIGAVIVAMETKLRAMSDATERLHAHSEKLRELAAKRYRYTERIASEAKIKRLLPGANPTASSVGQLIVYKSRIWLNFVLISLFESIPIIDMWPHSLLKILRVYRDQHIQYRTAREFVLRGELFIDKLTKQDDIEIRYLMIALREARRLMARASGILQRAREFIRPPQRDVPRAKQRATAQGSIFDVGPPQRSPAPAIS